MSEIIAHPSREEKGSHAIIGPRLRSPVDVVAVGDPAVEVSTEKVDTEILSSATGITKAVLLVEGETADPGAPPPRIEKTPRHTVYATPVVRQLASQLGVDLSSLAGTGRGGRISRADVTAAAMSER